MAHTVMLALDADSAGQEAMLRASGLAAKRKLELRVVPLPVGADPAELIQREGAEAMGAAVEKSVPFVRFRVERVLENGDDTSPEGRDRTIEELRPVFAQLAPGAMRMELARMASGRLAVPESLFEQQIARGAARASGKGRDSGGRPSGRQDERAGNGSRAALTPMSGREDAERAFLALCIAAPEQGAALLASVDVERDFSSELLRRAALRLHEVDLREPMAVLPGETVGLDADAELKRLLAELVVEAGRGGANPTMLEAQRLQLELARVEREIAQARGRRSGEVSELAQRKATVKRDFDRAYARVLEETGERED